MKGTDIKEANEFEIELVSAGYICPSITDILHIMVESSIETISPHASNKKGFYERYKEEVKECEQITRKCFFCY